LAEYEKEKKALEDPKVSDSALLKLMKYGPVADAVLEVRAII